MRLVTNSGGDRVIDELRQSVQGSGSLDLACPQFSLFAFAEVAELLGRLAGCRLVLPDGDAGDLELLGGAGSLVIGHRSSIIPVSKGVRFRWACRRFLPRRATP